MDSENSGCRVSGLAHGRTRLRVLVGKLARAYTRAYCAGPAMLTARALHGATRLSALEHEVFAVLHLDAQSRLLEYVEMFRGTVSQTSVYPREIVKETLARNSAALILVHNHPSGVARPSRADEALTQTLKAALSLIDVRVLDHLIVAGADVASFAEMGLL